MRIVELDAGSWTTPRDALRALHDAIGTPDMQDWNIDVLIDAIVGEAHRPIRSASAESPSRRRRQSERAGAGIDSERRAPLAPQPPL